MLVVRTVRYQELFIKVSVPRSGGENTDQNRLCCNTSSDSSGRWDTAERGYQLLRRWAAAVALPRHWVRQRSCTFTSIVYNRRFAFCGTSLRSCAATRHRGTGPCLTAIQRGLKASGGDTAGPCTSKYYISPAPRGKHLRESFSSAICVSLSHPSRICYFHRAHKCLSHLAPMSLHPRQSQSSHFPSAEQGSGKRVCSLSSGF